MQTLLQLSSEIGAKKESGRTVHFYGHKGGQARSTVLAVLAMALAERDWRVLCVDMDAEAPSLDLMLGVRPSTAAETLVGIRAGLQGCPIRALTPARGVGYVDLLAFRLASPDFDLDAAALAMELAMAPPAATELIDAVRGIRAEYDLLFVDHRTGIAPSVPPWIHSLPGPVVAFARMDGQWQTGARYLEALWSRCPEAPGAVVSFKPDDEPDFDYALRAMPQVRELLEHLANAINLGLPEDNGQEPLTGEDVRDHWVLWPYDPVFRDGARPPMKSLGQGIREGIAKLTRLLGLDRPPKRTEKDQKSVKLSPSGATDEGDLIVTDALRRLQAPNSPYWFILGRKGTGKTRLVRELSAQGRGEPLLVAEAEGGPLGIPAANPTLIRLVAECRETPSRLWWELVGAALEVGSTKREGMVAALKSRLQASEDSAIERVQELARRSPEPRMFLIDGLETAFQARDTHEFVGALFRVWASLDSDERLRSRLRLRVFVRTDLAQRGFPNLEQLLHSRSLYLEWDTQAIFNFALSRIAVIDWYRTHFPAVVEDLQGLRERIQRGELSTVECEELLLKIFPTRMRRQNMLTTTFLRTWFSDDPKGESGYYPRIYDTFLRQISELQGGASLLEEDPETHEREPRIAGELTLRAHEKATEDFLGQIQQELGNLVELDSNEVVRLMEAFRGHQTPFDLRETLGILAEKTTLSQAQVKEALEQMKSLKIFEDRDGYPGQWRVGRLFKTALGMRYNRRRREDNPTLP